MFVNKSSATTDTAYGDTYIFATICKLRAQREQTHSKKPCVAQKKREVYSRNGCTNSAVLTLDMQYLHALHSFFFLPSSSILKYDKICIDKRSCVCHFIIVIIIIIMYYMNIVDYDVCIVVLLLDAEEDKVCVHTAPQSNAIKN